MSSLKEKMETMPRVIVEGTEFFVIEVRHSGVKLCEFLASCQEVQWTMDKTTIKMDVSSPNNVAFPTTYEIEVPIQNKKVDPSDPRHVDYDER